MKKGFMKPECFLEVTNKHTATRGFVSQVSRKVLIDGLITSSTTLFQDFDDKHEGFDKRNNKHMVR